MSALATAHICDMATFAASEPRMPTLLSRRVLRRHHQKPEFAGLRTLFPTYPPPRFPLLSSFSAAGADVLFVSAIKDLDEEQLSYTCNWRAQKAEATISTRPALSSKTMSPIASFLCLGNLLYQDGCAAVPEGWL